MDEEQRKHIEELATWKKEAKAAQEKVRVHFVCLLYMIEKCVRGVSLTGERFVTLFLSSYPLLKRPCCGYF